MNYKSAVIINHSPLPSATQTAASVKEMLDYYARLGRHDSGGCDEHETPSDERAATRAEIDNVRDMVDYAAREGRFEYRLKGDAPLVQGERSGGLWTREGPIGSDVWAKRILESGSHVMRSVVAVRIEDTPQVGLTSKEAWQDLIRGRWDAHAASWGVIESQNIEWAAAYHVDGKESLHVHIMTIDKTGAWGGSARVDIPHERFTEANRSLRAQVLRPVTDRLNCERDALRGWMHERVRAHMGRGINDARADKATLLLQRAGIALPHPAKNTIDRDFAHDMEEHLLSLRPPGSEGKVLSFARSSPEMREAAKGAIETLKRIDEPFGRAYEEHHRLCKEYAQAVGKTGIEVKDGKPVPREAAYAKACEVEENTRLANALITSLRESERGRVWREAPGRDGQVPEHGIYVRRRVHMRIGGLERGAEKGAEARLREVRKTVRLATRARLEDPERASGQAAPKAYVRRLAHEHAREMMRDERLRDACDRNAGARDARESPTPARETTRDAERVLPEERTDAPQRDTREEGHGFALGGAMGAFAEALAYARGGALAGGGRRADCMDREAESNRESGEKMGHERMGGGRMGR